jgi:branched-chain amino acid transport system permease protein
MTEFYIATLNGITLGAIYFLVTAGFPQFRLFALGLAAAIGVVIWLLLRYSRVGLIIRAGIDDRAMVSALGINVQLVFAIGALLAGLGGVMPLCLRSPRYMVTSTWPPAA